MVLGEPLRRGSYTRVVVKYSDFGPIEGYISETVQDRNLGSKLVLITSRKSYIWAFDWYQNQWPWMTLNDIMAVILRYFSVFGSFQRALRKSGWRYTPRKNGTPTHPIFGPCLLWPNGWVDEDATQYGSRLRPGHFVLDGFPAIRERGTAAPLSSAHVCCGHGRPSQLLLSSCLTTSYSYTSCTAAITRTHQWMS